MKVVKNKVAPPFREAEFDIVFGKGVNYRGELVDTGIALGLIDKAGAWYSFNGERIGHGRENSIAWLEQNPEAVKLLAENIRTRYDLDRKQLHGAEVSIVEDDDDVPDEPDTE